MSERFFTALDLQKSKTIQLEEQEHHHLTRVLRVLPGEEVELINGRGFLAKATLQQSDKRTSVLEIDQVEFTPKPTPELILAQGIPRPQKLDWLVEKGTELGMTQLWLFPGEKGVRETLNSKQLERLRLITIAALKQSGSLWLPEIRLVDPIAQWKSFQEQLLFGSLDPTAPAFWKQKPTTTILVVGPESGLTSQEHNHLHKIGGVGVKLHTHILRTETAGIAALALWASICDAPHR